MPNQGASTAVVKAAFEAMGHTLVVDFYPWSRAVAEVKDSGKYAGYFPEYYYDSDEFVFSDSTGKGPLGFVEAKAKPISWSTLKDLTPYTIGVVQDYVNTEELDNMIAKGELKSSTVTSDSQNILKVSTGRVDLAVIDSNVLKYLQSNDPKLKSAAGSVQMNSKLLIEKDLFVAFKNDANGRKWQGILNEGLKKIDIQAIMHQYIQ
ncbi:substrate-binding periplasmic protein [Gynuella sunshinyii]|uniref:substrate-binding periplasmic protein n=1 Tax=Gynuella sunshinyii TaxID=1445505 RepID=UPI001FE206BD|nr:ABC transporter substrate-binding protein [Gynuella sunshinyii]